jgi:ADP-ribosylglycohydrolase
MTTLVPGAATDRLAGTLLGTAPGDALGLPAEGLSARPISRMFGRIDRFRLLGGTGFVSDDTEQAALVAQSLARHHEDVMINGKVSMSGAREPEAILAAIDQVTRTQTTRRHPP